MTKPNDETANATPATPPARRRRGPNKPKPPSLITVSTDARMEQDAITQVLTQYVTDNINAETATGMELQWHNEGVGWVPATDKFPRVRFVTKGIK